MTQTFAGLKQRAAEIRGAQKLATYKRQITELNMALVKARERLRAEEARAELAERQARQMAAERNIWKFQAEEAQAELKSRGAR